MCVHCNLAKPTNSMTRIQEVFRTLMGPKQMMLASRGKKAGGLRGDNTFPESAAERPSQALGERNTDSFWIMADERVPVAVLRNDWAWQR
ncbi:hypothetical protein niasHT_023455 [Heterodera trifolii]|uniref:Uncharacterized protein n=1 Tax=Heterodera trifolii TaxID=157864 RepID=A0ABD2JJ69_9BILA